jgi:hypothetical protein
MRIAWISLNLIGLALVVVGAIYTPHNRNVGLPILFAGFLFAGTSNVIRARIFRDK